MKKTLVAIAAVVATTGAMAEVTISGIIDQAYVRTVASTSTTSATTTSVGGQYTGGDLNIAGSEDLGNGMTAKFQLGFTTEASSTAATNYGNYVSYLSLSGGFGSIKVGQFWSPLHITSATYDAADYSQVNTQHQVSQAASGSVGTGTGQLIAGQIQYTLPSLMEGLNIQVGTAQAEATGSSVGNQNNYGLSYSSGPFSVGYSGSIVETSTTTETTNTSSGASYDLGMAKLFYAVQTRKLSSAAATDQGTQFGVQVPLGALKIGVSSTTYTMASVAANTAGSGYNMLFKYDLSKRTSFIAQTGQTKVTSGTTSGAISQTTAVGLLHFF